MSSPESTSHQSADLLRRIERGDEEAAEAVFRRYAERLTRLARSRLSARLAARVDADDIVNSAYRSFFVAAREGRFAVERGGDLWRLLVEIALHKLYHQAEHHRAQRRSVQRESSQNASLVGELISREPSPEDAAAAADELELLLKQLPEREREAVVLALQGYEREEIATRLQYTERTVRRWLANAKRFLIARGGGSFVPSAARRLPADSNRRAPIPAAAIPLESPLAWSDFLLQQQIGVGATGKVYRALQRSTGKLVAVKFLKKSLLEQTSVVERFVQEAKTVAELQHAGIVAVHGIGRTPGGGLFLLMDLVRGQDLERIGRPKTVDIAQTVEWVAEAARIVHFAHERGIIHCDLKPSNLLCDEEGSIRVTDFGLALRLIPGACPADRLAGTPAFMAPEQVDSLWGVVSPRTDVWGLGTVLYFLLYGAAPHAGRDVAETLSFVVSGKPVPLESDRSASLPAALLSVLARCLAKQPLDRFATALALAEALQETNSGLVGLPRPGRLSVAASRRVQS